MAWGGEILDPVVPASVDLNQWVCAACGTRYGRRVEICLGCWRTGVIVPVFERTTSNIAPRRKGMTAKALASTDQRTLSPRSFPSIKFQRDAFATASGPPGSGKSTLGLMLAADLTPAVFVSWEMGVGPVLAEMLRRLEIRSEDLMIEEPKTTNELFEIASRSDLKCLVIDSVTTSILQPEDCLNLARSYKMIVLAIQQQTKAGQAAGSNQWPHLADVVLECDSMRWTLMKSRYQELISGEILGG